MNVDTLDRKLVSKILRSQDAKLLEHSVILDEELKNEEISFHDYHSESIAAPYHTLKECFVLHGVSIESFPQDDTDAYYTMVQKLQEIDNINNQSNQQASFNPFSVLKGLNV